MTLPDPLASADAPVELVFRSLHRHHEPRLGPKGNLVLLGLSVVALVAYLGWSVHRIFPALTWSDLSRAWARASEHPDLRSWDEWPMPLFWLLVWVFQWLWSRNLRLHISPQGIRQVHCMPLGLHHLFGQSWSVRWADVRSVTVRQRMDHPSLDALAMVEVELTGHKGWKKTLRPAYWFRPGDPPRPRMKCPPSVRMLDVSNPWLREKARAQVAQTFDALPAMEALNRLGAAHGHRFVWARGQLTSSRHDLNRQPELLVLSGATLLVFVGGFVAMVAQPYLHLHAAPGWVARLGLALGSLLGVTVPLAAWRQWRLRRSGRHASDTLDAPEPLDRTAAVVVAVLWLAAVAFMAEPWLVHAGHWGRSDRAETVRYRVEKGQAFALMDPTATRAADAPGSRPVIELPGSSSRLARIRDGSEANLTLIPARWGLWVYDDRPLRQLADEQGVR
jgi:hypothetical protein